MICLADHNHHIGKYALVGPPGYGFVVALPSVPFLASAQKCTHATFLQDGVFQVRVPWNHQQAGRRDYSSHYYPHSLLARCMSESRQLRDFFVKLSWHAQTNMLQATLPPRSLSEAEGTTVSRTSCGA